ncbi:MAG: 3'-5' exonuclease, partial [Paramuribaculum sp.]|nr:3'-5' exonuclease [Paramuribaculum sp.]
LCIRYWLDMSKTRLVDVQTIYHKLEPRNLTAAYRFYCGKNLEDAHSASADTRATLEVLKAQLERYSELTNDIKSLSEFSSHGRNVDFAGRLVFNDDNKEVINFGKYKGKIAEEVLRNDPGYYSWIQQGDFQQNTKDAFARIRLRIDAKRRSR